MKKKCYCVAALCFSLMMTACGTTKYETGTNPKSGEETYYTQEMIDEVAKSIDYPRLSVNTDNESMVQISSDSKKGLQIEEGKIEDAIDLGISYGFINFYYNEFLSTKETKYSYEYKDKTYYYDEAYVERTDYLIKRMSDEDIKVIAAVVNGYSEDFPELRYPGIDLNPGTQYYAFNAVTEEGRDLIEAAMCFILERYNGEEYGSISDWVIGNEVNDNLQYNYIGPCSGEHFVEEYYKQFKLFYNIIRKYDEDCDVYIPMEHRWNTANTMTDYGGKWFLEYFHECELKDQEMDWGLAWHPYPYPLGDADTLDDGDEPTTDTDGQPTFGGEVTMEYTSPLVSMKNIHVITDFLSENLLTASGQPRSLICSEVGYTSFSVVCGENQSKQAANITFANYRAQMDPMIKAFIIRCQVDVNEGSPYFKFGLRSGSEDKYLDKKLAFDVYKYLDSTDAADYTDDCKAVLGIKDWSEVIDHFDPDIFKEMKSYENLPLLRAEDFTNIMLPEESYVGVVGAYEDYGYCDEMYRCYFFEDESVKKAANGKYFGFEITNNKRKSKSLYVRIRIRKGSDYYEAESVIDAGKRELLAVDCDITDADNVELWISDAETLLSDDINVTVKAVILDGSETIKFNKSLLEKKNKTDVNTLSYSEIEKLTYTGYHQKPEVTVKDGEKVLEDTVDYCISYANDKKPGIATAIIQGLGDYEGTHVIEYEIDSKYGDVFDPIYYADRYHDLKELFGYDPTALEDHFIMHGMKEGRTGSKEFCPYYYRENYPDLYEAYGDDMLCYYLHYIKVGKEEGRDGSKLANTALYKGVDYTPVYDAAYYASNMWDKFDYYCKNEWNLLQDFVENGMSRGERGSAEFDVYQYKNAHPELVEEYGDDLKAYYMHYLEIGYQNGESGTPEEEPVWDPSEPLVYRGNDLSLVYDPEYYVSHYSDVSDIADDPEALIRHFAIYGMKEARRGNYAFDPKLYYARYIDVRNSFGNLVELTYKNYIVDGYRLGR